MCACLCARTSAQSCAHRPVYVPTWDRPGASAAFYKDHRSELKSECIPLFLGRVRQGTAKRAGHQVLQLAHATYICDCTHTSIGNELPRVDYSEPISSHCFSREQCVPRDLLEVQVLFRLKEIASSSYGNELLPQCRTASAFGCMGCNRACCRHVSVDMLVGRASAAAATRCVRRVAPHAPHVAAPRCPPGPPSVTGRRGCPPHLDRAGAGGASEGSVAGSVARRPPLHPSPVTGRGTSGDRPECGAAGPGVPSQPRAGARGVAGRDRASAPRVADRGNVQVPSALTVTRAQRRRADPGAHGAASRKPAGLRVPLNAPLPSRGPPTRQLGRARVNGAASPAAAGLSAADPCTTSAAGPRATADQVAIIVAHEVVHLVARHHSLADCWPLLALAHIGAGNVSHAGGSCIHKQPHSVNGCLDLIPCF